MTNQMENFFRKLMLAVVIAVAEFQTRYQRLRFGSVWVVLATGFSIVCVGVIWSLVFNRQINAFLTHYSIGLIIWIFISGLVNDAATLQLKYRNLRLNANISSFNVCLINISTHLIILIQNSVLIVLFLLYQGQTLSLITLLFVPNFILILLLMFFLTNILSVIGARFRDLEPFIKMMLQPLFLLSPILYKASDLGDLSWILLINPVHHILELLRGPLVGELPSFHSYAIVVIMFAIFAFVSQLIRVYYEKHVNTWVT